MDLKPRRPGTSVNPESVHTHAKVDVTELTRRIAKGDESAYREFYDAYFGRLSRYLLVVAAGNEDASREALQGTLIRLVRYVKIFTSEEVFWSWLTVLARSSHTDNLRKRGRYRAFMDRFTRHSHTEHAAQVDPDIENRLDEALKKEIKALTPDERQLIQFKYTDEMSVADIAAKINLSEKAVESWLARVRRKLKKAVLKVLGNEKSFG